MQISKSRLILIFSLVALSLFGVMYIQYNILTRDIIENEKQMDFAIPGILVEVHDRLNWNKDFRNKLHIYKGVEDFVITNSSDPEEPIRRQIKHALDKTLSLNYPDMDYTLNAFISSDHACLIHNHHHEGLKKANKVLDAENHLCLCNLSPTTLDISLTYPNKKNVALEESRNALFISLFLVLFVMLSFGFAITIITRQKKLSAMKKDFVNNLTHEFKTPLFSISLASKALKKSESIKGSPALNKYIDIIENERYRLQNQVDKILQVALIDSGNLNLEKKQVDLHDIIEKVSDSFRMVINERNGHLKLKLNSDHHVVHADETHLKNIIYNLLDNAQKYSEGEPRIEVITEDHKDGILFTVKDNGIGMDEVAQKFIFDQFYRAKAEDVKNTKGFGLGLSYVKSIVEAHKGWINLDSELTQGSQFTIYLPFA